MLFKNATIYTMEEDPFIGDFRVNKGVFTEIGKNLEPKDEDVQDLTGFNVYPGPIVIWAWKKQLLALKAMI